MKWSKSKWFPNNMKSENSISIFCGDVRAVCGDMLCDGILIKSTLSTDSDINFEIKPNLSEEFIKMFIDEKQRRNLYEN